MLNIYRKEILDLCIIKMIVLYFTWSPAVLVTYSRSGMRGLLSHSRCISKFLLPNRSFHPYRNEFAPLRLIVYTTVFAMICYRTCSAMRRMQSEMATVAVDGKEKCKRYKYVVVVFFLQNYDRWVDQASRAVTKTITTVTHLNPQYYGRRSLSILS